MFCNKKTIDQSKQVVLKLCSVTSILPLESSKDIKYKHDLKHKKWELGGERSESHLIFKLNPGTRHKKP